MHMQCKPLHAVIPDCCCFAHIVIVLMSTTGIIITIIFIGSIIVSWEDVQLSNKTIHPAMRPQLHTSLLLIFPELHIPMTLVSKSTWCLTSTETIRLIRDGMMGGRGYGGGGRGRLHTYRYTVTTRMTSALRWATVRAILMFHNCEGQRHKTVSTDHIFEEKGSRSGFEPRSPCLPA